MSTRSLPPTDPLEPRLVADRAIGPQLHTTTHDRARWLTWTSVAGVIAAITLAAIGGFPFEVPMVTYRFGVVTPTCGLTRGSTAIARGDFALAFRYNPASFLVIGFGIVGVTRAAIGVTTRHWLDVPMRYSRSIWIVGCVAVLALWGYQQTNAEFIINSRL